MIQPTSYAMLVAPFAVSPPTMRPHEATPVGGGPRQTDSFLAVKDDETYVENAKALVGLLKTLATSAF